MTGHTGFTGSWAVLVLKELGAEVVGYALAPSTEPSLFLSAAIEDHCKSYIGDINDISEFEKVVKNTKPDVILHLAAQPLVLEGYSSPRSTFETNVLGTANVIDVALSNENVVALVCVTTDKVYRNDNSGKSYNELDPLGGRDPYSASKVGTEMVVAGYRSVIESRENTKLKIGVARGGNIIGGGDWAENRIFPDMARSWFRGETLKVRMPSAVRPWQHVLSLVDGYVRVIDLLLNGENLPTDLNWNFGPNQYDSNISVQEIVSLASKRWPSLRFELFDEIFEESHILSIDSAKAASELGWIPQWGLSESVDKTIDWYTSFRGDEQAALSFCMNQIHAYLGE